MSEFRERPALGSGSYHPYGLSEQEMAVLKLIVEGLADREIATRLDISPFTVNEHVAQILLKLDATSRTGAAVKAIKLGIVR
jgi:DNA-binding NarL/FixJ family response regulator